MPRIEVCSTYSQMNLFGGEGIWGIFFSGFGLVLQIKEVTAPRRSAPGVSFSCQTLLISNRCLAFPANSEKGTLTCFSSGLISLQQGKELHLGCFYPRPLPALNTHPSSDLLFPSLWQTPCLLLKIQ